MVMDTSGVSKETVVGTITSLSHNDNLGEDMILKIAKMRGKEMREMKKTREEQ